jgi:hypothetical protein
MKIAAPVNSLSYRLTPFSPWRQQLTIPSRAGLFVIAITVKSQIMALGHFW